LKPWEIWTWQDHPCVIISNAVRAERKQRIDLLFTAPKSALSQKRGEVQWERRRDISRKIIQGLALAGL
jgi:hypothetical protein